MDLSEHELYLYETKLYVLQLALPAGHWINHNQLKKWPRIYSRSVRQINCLSMYAATWTAHTRMYVKSKTRMKT